MAIKATQATLHMKTRKDGQRHAAASADFSDRSVVVKPPDHAFRNSESVSPAFY